jgi:transposase-like protein
MRKGYLNVAQVVERFGGISRRTLYNWRKQYNFPDPVGPHKNLYSIEAIEAFESVHFESGEVANG